MISIRKRIPFSYLAFIFWFIYQINISMTYLFFQNNPKVGTIEQFFTIFLAVYFIIIAILNKGLNTKIKSNIGTYLILIFICWSGFTIFWTPNYLTALFYWFFNICEIMFVYFLFRLSPSKEIAIASIKGIFWGSTVLTIILLTTLRQGLGLDRLGDEQYLHPNVVGNQLAIASICGMYLIFSRYIKNKMLFGVFLLFIIITFFLTLSKTAILAFAMSFLIYMFKVKIGFFKKMFISLIALGVIGVFFQRLQEQWLIYSSLGNGKILTTFSGRTIIWDMVWEKIKEHPILGHGFFSFQEVGPQPFEIQIGSAHNEVLNVWFNFGIIGLLIAIFIYIVFLKRIHKINKIYKKRSGITEATLASALLIYFIVRGLTEGHPTGLVFNLPLFLLMFEWLYLDLTDD